MRRCFNARAEPPALREQPGQPGASPRCAPQTPVPQPPRGMREQGSRCPHHPARANAAPAAREPCARRGTRAAPRSHGSHLCWAGQAGTCHRSSGSAWLLPLQPAQPRLETLHLTKYLHEMAIRLPRFNENVRAGSRTVAELMLPSTSSSWAEGAAPAGEMAAPRSAARWHRCCQGCRRAGVGWRVMQE